MREFPPTKQAWQAGGGISGLLATAAHENGHAVFLRDHLGNALTYSETLESARALAGFLNAEGLKRGDRIAIHFRNRAEVAVAIFASAMLGAIHVVLHSKLKPAGLRKILDQAEPLAILGDHASMGNLVDLEFPNTKIRLHLGEHLPAGWQSWEEAVRHPPFTGNWTGIDVDIACLVFTSGSTGTPRGVSLSHDNVCYAVSAIQERLRYRPDDVVGCFLPLSFDYGLYQIFLAATSGAALYIGDPDQVGPRLPRLMKEAGISILPGVPSIAAALLSLGRRRALDLPSLRAITNTGERLPPAHIAELQDLLPGVDVFVMYGLTECKRVSILTPSELLTHSDSVGRPLAGTEVYAVDDAGRRLAPGETGELVVRGRHVAHGYWRAPNETALRFRKRSPGDAVELFTGDSGFVDEEGFLYFSSRRDDLLKHRGNRISPLEIEQEACALPGVVEAALLQRKADETLHLFVTLSEPVSGDAIIGSLSNTLEPAKIPDFVVSLAEMPKSINGKIDRKSLAARLSPPPEIAAPTA